MHVFPGGQSNSPAPVIVGSEVRRLPLTLGGGGHSRRICEIENPTSNIHDWLDERGTEGYMDQGSSPSKSNGTRI